jgi:hypothetical protein
MDVEAWAAPNVSYGLSARFVNPDKPPNREFHYSKTCTEMSPRNRNHINGLAAQLVGQVLQRFGRKGPKICRIINGIQQRGFRMQIHRNT